ncbi:hypothetical protein GCM10010503_40300 [Streptomyces lucensis JCM 4490]|uniref:Uncharacterized protein n=1 Tax=Streptomyces lucensis JCM 4490 TaxID=1306176 RepID=A0A918J9B4_9ACTN|nr:hypothetical protein GCM10010503_40300 [Streptomyces lucensis JCM 4490]
MAASGLLSGAVGRERQVGEGRAERGKGRKDVVPKEEPRMPKANRRRRPEAE